MSTHIPCPCPGLVHPDGDSITLRQKLDFERALTIRNEVLRLMREQGGQSVALAALTKAYAFVGIESWTLVDAKGKPLPVDRAAIAMMLEGLADDPLAASAFADAADELYAETYLLPLLRRASTSLSDSPSDESTSPPMASEPSPESPTPSSQSWTTTTPTAGIATTSRSLVGASS